MRIASLTRHGAGVNTSCVCLLGIAIERACSIHQYHFLMKFTYCKIQGDCVCENDWIVFLGIANVPTPLFITLSVVQYLFPFFQCPFHVYPRLVACPVQPSRHCPVAAAACSPLLDVHLQRVHVVNLGLVHGDVLLQPVAVKEEAHVFTGGDVPLGAEARQEGLDGGLWPHRQPDVL